MAGGTLRVVNTEQAATEFTTDELGFRCVFLASQDVLTAQFRGADGKLHSCVLASGYTPKDIESERLVASAICHALNAGASRGRLVDILDVLLSFASDKRLNIPLFKPAGLCYELTTRYVWPSTDGTTVMVIHPDVSSELFVANDG